MKLRENLENVDPFHHITIASVCMTIYRSNYMPKKTIAIIPESIKTDNFSKMSIMWLNYVSNGINIKHALNGSEETNSMVAFGMDVQNATNPIS